MCIFAGSRDTLQRLSVGGTTIYACAHGDRQFLVYGMNVEASEPVAMVLPLPIPPGGGESALRFVDLSGYPRFFHDVDECFPPFPQPAALSFEHRPQGAASVLVVHKVGGFEASFVPTLADFSRLDERFRVDAAVWDALPELADWGFAVFQLRDLTDPGWVGRWLGRGGKRTIHPMAMDFPRRDPTRLYFPTVHVHDGELHPEATFDHTLYWQHRKERPPDSYTAVSLPATTHVDVSRALGMVAPHKPFHRRMLLGTRPNADHWVDDP